MRELPPQPHHPLFTSQTPTLTFCPLGPMTQISPGRPCGQGEGLRMAEAWHLPGTAAPLGRVNAQLPTLPALSQSLTSPSAPRSLDVNVRTLEVRGS